MLVRGNDHLEVLKITQWMSFDIHSIVFESERFWKDFGNMAIFQLCVIA